MTKMFHSFILLCACGALFVGCNKSPEEKADYVVKKVTRKLDLNDNQKAKLVELKDAWLDTKKRRQKDKEDIFSEVKRLVAADKVQEGEVRDLITKKEKIVAEEFPNFFPKLQAFHASLSPAQKQKAIEIMEKIHKKRCGH